MKHHFLLAALVLAASVPTFAGSLSAAAAIANFGAGPLSYDFVFGSPYIDGPIGSVAQSIAIVGMDSTGDGFSMTNISLATSIDGSVVHTTNIGDCTLAPGGAGAAVGCSPGGDQWAASSQAISQSTSGGEFFTTNVNALVSGGDVFIATYYASLSGFDVSGAPVSTYVTGAFAVQNTTANPLPFNFVFGTLAPAGRYTQANLNFAGSILDREGDGASADIDVTMSLGPMLLSLGIQDTCAVNNGMLTGTICRGGTGFAPLQFGATGGNTGLISMEWKATMSGNGDSAAFETAMVWSESEPVPEPATSALMLGGIAVLALVRRRR